MCESVEMATEKENHRNEKKRQRERENEDEYLPSCLKGNAPPENHKRRIIGMNFIVKFLNLDSREVFSRE